MLGDQVTVSFEGMKPWQWNLVALMKCELLRYYPEELSCALAANRSLEYLRIRISDVIG